MWERFLRGYGREEEGCSCLDAQSSSKYRDGGDGGGRRIEDWDWELELELELEL